jgi:hypothetical protein
MRLAEETQSDSPASAYRDLFLVHGHIGWYGFLQFHIKLGHLLFRQGLATF